MKKLLIFGLLTLLLFTGCDLFNSLPEQIGLITANSSRGDFIVCSYDKDAIGWYNSFANYASGINVSAINFPLTNAETFSPQYGDLVRDSDYQFSTFGDLNANRKNPEIFFR